MGLEPIAPRLKGVCASQFFAFCGYHPMQNFKGYPAVQESAQQKLPKNQGSKKKRPNQ